MFSGGIKETSGMAWFNQLLGKGLRNSRQVARFFTNLPFYKEILKGLLEREDCEFRQLLKRKERCF